MDPRNVTAGRRTRTVYNKCVVYRGEGGRDYDERNGGPILIAFSATRNNRFNRGTVSLTGSRTHSTRNVDVAENGGVRYIIKNETERNRIVTRTPK